MPAAPLPDNESQRLAALIACNVLDTEREDDFDDLTRLAAQTCGTPVALVSLIDQDRQWFKSTVGLSATQTPRDQAFCAYAILADAPLVIEDATKDLRTLDNPLVTGEPGIRFYAGHPLKLPTGEVVGTLCVIDFEPRRADAELLDHLRALANQATSQLELRRRITQAHAATRRAEHADQAKSEFLANMSHEIRTPMTAVLGFADLLATDAELRADAARTDEAIDIIREHGRHLLTVINDILDVSKIEAGRIEIDWDDTDLAGVMAGVVELMSAAADERGTRLITRYDTDVPDAIRSDPTRLRQVLINLVGNAVKFTEGGTVTLAVACRAQPPRVTIEVSDTGVGMTAEQLERVRAFDAFTQADASVSRRYGGTGLGLKIAHHFADALGGGLAVDSAPGRGTTFTVTIDPGDLADRTMVPADRVADRLVRTPARARHADASGGDAPLAGLTVLVADDTKTNRRLVSALLEKSGAGVVLATNGREAIDAIETHAGPIDLVLMDVQMPELDGHAATRALRADGFTRPIVALTANAMTDSQRACFDAGCDAFLAKPIDAQRLIDTCLRLTRPERAPAARSAA
jgi:signal transduction histidine kinase/ActR/RegA family two-component response regulator